MCQKKLHPNPPPVVTEVTDLQATPINDGVNLSWSVIGQGATNVKLQYKLSTDASFIESGESLTNVSTSATLVSLVDATSYNVKLKYNINGVDHFSNIVTFTTL